MSTTVYLKGETIRGKIDNVDVGNAITGDNGQATISNLPDGKEVTVSADNFPDVTAKATIKGGQTVNAGLDLTSKATVTIPVLVTKKDGKTPLASVVVTWARKGKALITSAATGADGKTSIATALPGAEADNTLSCTVAGKTKTLNVAITQGMSQVTLVTDVDVEVGSVLVTAYITIAGTRIEIPV